MENLKITTILETNQRPIQRIIEENSPIPNIPNSNIGTIIETNPRVFPTRK